MRPSALQDLPHTVAGIWKLNTRKKYINAEKINSENIIN
jgi:hypothetical protein